MSKFEALYEKHCIPIRTAVSAKFRGAFCEARIDGVERILLCRIQLSDKKTIKVNLEDIISDAVVNTKVKYKFQSVVHTGILLKIIDNSNYHVVFDDDDTGNLRRNSLFLKGDRHFKESECLDKNPLTNPEHFTRAVVAEKPARERSEIDDDDFDVDDQKSCSQESQLTVSSSKTRFRPHTHTSSPSVGTVTSSMTTKVADDSKNKNKTINKRGPNTKYTIGSLIVVNRWTEELCNEKNKMSEKVEKPKKCKSFVGLIVSPSSVNKDLSDIRPTQCILKSFQNEKCYLAYKKDVELVNEREQILKNKEFDVRMGSYFEKCLLYFDMKILPKNWNKEVLLSSPSSSTTNESNTEGGRKSKKSGLNESNSIVSSISSISGDEDDEISEDEDDNEEDDEDNDNEDEKNSEIRDAWVARFFNFWDATRSPITNEVLSIAGTDIDLYKLFRLVTNYGGHQKVTTTIRWPSIYYKLKLPEPSTEMYQKLMQIYKKYIYPFVDMAKKLGTFDEGRARKSTERSDNMSYRRSRGVSTIQSSTSNAATQPSGVVDKPVSSPTNQSLLPIVSSGRGKRRQSQKTLPQPGTLPNTESSTDSIDKMEASSLSVTQSLAITSVDLGTTGCSSILTSSVSMASTAATPLSSTSIIDNNNWCSTKSHQQKRQDPDKKSFIATTITTPIVSNDETPIKKARPSELKLTQQNVNTAATKLVQSASTKQPMVPITTKLTQAEVTSTKHIQPASKPCQSSTPVKLIPSTHVSSAVKPIQSSGAKPLSSTSALSTTTVESSSTLKSIQSSVISTKSNQSSHVTAKSESLTSKSVQSTPSLTLARPLQIISKSEEPIENIFTVSSCSLPIEVASTPPINKNPPASTPLINTTRLAHGTLVNVAYGDSRELYKAKIIPMTTETPDKISGKKGGHTTPSTPIHNPLGSSGSVEDDNTSGTSTNSVNTLYKVHYVGWNPRHDEIISHDRIIEVLSSENNLPNNTSTNFLGNNSPSNTSTPKSFQKHLTSQKSEASSGALCDVDDLVMQKQVVVSMADNSDLSVGDLKIDLEPDNSNENCSQQINLTSHNISSEQEYIAKDLEDVSTRSPSYSNVADASTKSDANLSSQDDPISTENVIVTVDISSVVSDSIPLKNKVSRPTLKRKRSRSLCGVSKEGHKIPRKMESVTEESPLINSLNLWKTSVKSSVTIMAGALVVSKAPAKPKPANTAVDIEVSVKKFAKSNCSDDDKKEGKPPTDKLLEKRAAEGGLVKKKELCNVGIKKRKSEDMIPSYSRSSSSAIVITDVTPYQTTKVKEEQKEEVESDAGVPSNHSEMEDEDDNGDYEEDDDCSVSSDTTVAFQLYDQQHIFYLPDSSQQQGTNKRGRKPALSTTPQQNKSKNDPESTSSSVNSSTRRVTRSSRNCSDNNVGNNAGSCLDDASIGDQSQTSQDECNSNNLSGIFNTPQQSGTIYNNGTPNNNFNRRGNSHLANNKKPCLNEMVPLATGTPRRQGRTPNNNTPVVINNSNTNRRQRNTSFSNSSCSLENNNNRDSMNNTAHSVNTENHHHQHNQSQDNAYSRLGNRPFERLHPSLVPTDLGDMTAMEKIKKLEDLVRQTHLNYLDTKEKLKYVEKRINEIKASRTNGNTIESDEDRFR